MSFVITYAGQLESQMAACRIPIRTTKYNTIGEAKADLAMMIPGVTTDILANMVVVKGDGWYVYADQDAADADDDGSSAIACIMRAPKVTVTLSSHGMGDDATEADFDAYVEFVTERLDVPGVDLTVEAAEYGQPGDLVGDSEDTSEVHDALERLWDLFCNTPEAWPAKTLFALSVDHEGNTIDVENQTLEGLAKDLSEAGYDGPWVRVRSPKDDTTAGWVRANDWKV